MRAMIVVTCLVAALCGFPVRAQDAANPPDAHLGAAIDLLEATNAKANMVTIVDALTPVILGQVRAQNPRITDAIAQQFQAIFREEMIADLDSFVKLNAAIYEQHFTTEELRQLAEVYRTDVGKKYITTLPAIIKKSVPLGTAWGREAGARIAQRTLQRLRANGVNI